MDGFTLVDGIVAVVVVLSALLAYARGFVREALAILGWIIAAVLAFMFADAVVPLVKQIPVLGDFLGDNCELSLIASFALVFALVLVVMSLFAPLFSSVVQRSILGGVDQGAGFLFGVLRGVLLVAVAFFVYKVVLDAQDIPMIENSRSAVVFSKIIGDFDTRDPSTALTWLTGQYEDLISTCGN